MLTGYEHHHIVGRIIELALIGLGPQRLDMAAHCLGMKIKVALAFGIVVGLERGLIGVERNLRIDHQLLLPGHVDNRIGPQASVFGFPRVFQLKIGVLRQAALFEHVLQRPLPPAAAGLGGIGQRIAQPRGFGPDLFRPFAQRLDQARELAKGINPLLFQRLDLLLITFQPFINRGKQGLEPLRTLFFRLRQAFLRTIQQGFLGLGQDLCPGILKFLFQRFLRRQQPGLLIFEIGGMGLERGILDRRLA